jgi:hypothetical protein
LQGKAQSRVVHPPPGNQVAIPIIKVKIARELERRGVFRIAAVALLLVWAQELDGHRTSSIGFWVAPSGQDGPVRFWTTAYNK